MNTEEEKRTDELIGRFAEAFLNRDVVRPNMYLEKQLAQLQCLGTDLNRRFSNGRSDMPLYLRGIVSEARTLEENHRKAKHALKKGYQSVASEHVGSFAMAIKNMADNANRLLQALYGGPDERVEALGPIRSDMLYQYAYAQGIRPNLKNLDVNTQSAPSLDDGRRLCDLFVETHDTDPASPLITARNWQGHGDGHGIVFNDPGFPSRFSVGNAKSMEFVDAYEFLDDNGRKYMEMIGEVLDTVSRKDSEHFEGDRKLPSLTKRRYLNFLIRNKHKITKGMYRSTVAALLATMAVGNVMNCQRNNRLEESMARPSRDVVIPIENVETYYDMQDRLNAFSEAYTDLFGGTVRYRIEDLSTISADSTSVR